MEEKELQAKADMVLAFAGKAFEAMGDQFAAKSRTDDEIVYLCKKAWKIGIYMMRTSPFGAEESANAAAVEPDAGELASV